MSLHFLLEVRLSCISKSFITHNEQFYSSPFTSWSKLEHVRVKLPHYKHFLIDFEFFICAVFSFYLIFFDCIEIDPNFIQLRIQRVKFFL